VRGDEGRKVVTQRTSYWQVCSRSRIDNSPWEVIVRSFNAQLMLRRLVSFIPIAVDCFQNVLSRRKIGERIVQEDCLADSVTNQEAINLVGGRDGRGGGEREGVYCTLKTLNGY